MLFGWTLHWRGGDGIIVLQPDGAALALEYNELLRRIATGEIAGEDTVISRVFTDGKRRQVGDLRVYAMIRSGQVRADDLPRRFPDGVIASGAAAFAMLHALEHKTARDFRTLLRAVSPPVTTLLAREMLRAVPVALPVEKPEELLRPALPPDAPDVRP